MIGEGKSKIIAFQELSKTENVRLLNDEEKKISDFDSIIDVWEVDTEIHHENKCIRLFFQISFEKQFPFDFPKIYLSPDSFEKIKYIPHVDNDRLVCTFDSEIASTNPNEPAGIVVECIKRAKSIIMDGLTGVNQCDFDDEFKAYWEGKYGKEKHLPKTVLSLINTLQNDSLVKLICLKNPIQYYKYVLHTSDILSIRFKEFLAEYKVEFHEADVFYLKNFTEKSPPFTFKNRDVTKLVKDSNIEQLKAFETFINKSEYPKLVICKKQFPHKEYLFGWFHSHLKTNANGYRPGKFKPFNAFSTIQSNDIVERISTDVFTRERLENRTSGIDKLENEKCFAIAGVGSIGSNLLFFLNSYNSPEFRFIDRELIRLENIGRHLLGFEYIGVNKTKALKDYLLKNNPLQKVSTKEVSVIEVIKDDIDYINEADYFFMSIGKANIDNWVCQSLVEGRITKPIFIIWVEPFLCGGHCLYLHPSNPDYKKYFEDDLFKFNVIDREEYKIGNNNLSLREAGCQTTFIPYSGANVISFLSALFPAISSIIASNSTKSTSYTWHGNVEKIIELEIKTSKAINEFEKGKLIQNVL